ncbi:MAG: FlgD immunoglobulin-like domain containing protein, partial [Candidatus Zixiibacteriota bacterium]
SSVWVSDTNLIGSIPFDQFQYIDADVSNGQTYFYKVTSLGSGGESEGSNEASATPRKGAILTTDPNSIEVNLCAPDTVFEDLTLTNSGGLPLEFKMEIDMEEDTSWMGGSDKFGYTWTDKNLQSEFDYSWINIKDFGEEIGEPGDNDENYGFFGLNFPFSFYRNFFDSLRISSNGWISFTDTTAEGIITYVNKELPWIWGPYNLIAPFWDDLIFSDSSKIYFWSNNLDSAIISFINLDHWITGGPYTFQTILKKNGEMIFQYDKLGDRLNSATVGIQNQNGTIGLEVIYNQDYLEDSLWVKIRPGWISVDSMWGIIQPGQSKILNLTFERLSYPQGIYHANLVINSWDKNHELDPIEIPLTLYIDTTTSVDFEEDQKPFTFALFQNYPNPFNPATSIRYAVGSPQRKTADRGLWTADGSPTPVTLRIYNILGQKVRTLVDEPKVSGTYQVIWDGKDSKGKNVASGIYFYQLTAGDYKETRKMTFIR